MFERENSVMAKKTAGRLILVLVVLLTQYSLQARSEDAATPPIRDMLWVWGNPEMTTEGSHTFATFAQADPAERAALLGVPNIIMAGSGMPNDGALADALMQRVAGATRVVWEITPDGEGEDRPFLYTETIARVRRLAAAYPRIEGVLLDDMSTISVDRGFKPEHIRHIREELGEDHDRIKVWGVVYTMNLDRPGMQDYLHELDVINLWTWHARDVVDLEKNVAKCAEMAPGKPIVAGLYLHDYGEGRSIPQDLLETQCSTALALVRAGRVHGAVFLTIDNEPDTITWTANWVAQSCGPHPSARAEKLSLSQGEWDFSGDAWSEDAEGLIRPPDLRNLHSRAFHTERAYGDLAAEFEFNGSYRETGTGSAGLVLRATDPNHFYFVWFPWGGQQLRAKHFWAAVAKADGDGYLRNLAMEWVPGVPSETDRWYHVRVEACESRITVWVDGRRALSVDDDSYKDGCVGLAGYGWYAFRNISIEGNATAPPAWNSSVQAPAHACPLALSSKTMPTGCVTPNGDVLLAAENVFIRSTDKGCTWSDPQPLPGQLGPLSDYGSTLFCTAGKRLIAMIYRTQEASGKPVPEIFMAESADDGATWSDPIPAQVAEPWPTQPRNLVPYGPIVETADGTLLRFLLGGVKEENDTFTDVLTWSATHCKAFVIRGSDGGLNWSAPIEIDQPSWTGKARGTIPGSLDLTEPTAVAMGNTVMVLVRPVYSPTMWQCWSNDAGAAWDAAARATFPGYAQCMVRTAGGALLCAHRYPHYAVNISRDGGLNWDAGTVIDYPVWAMGCAIEVEPDVVLLTYMNAEQSMPLLAQRVRVTADGIAPVAE